MADAVHSATEASAMLLRARYQAVRALSLDLVAPLSDGDATGQSMPDASPAKWHLAHTTWFFETFILRDHLPGYQSYDARWAYLFNSYYEAEGARLARPQRGLLTRPALPEVIDYRHHVDDAMLAAIPLILERCPHLLALGLNHEQQHQELLLLSAPPSGRASPKIVITAYRYLGMTGQAGWSRSDIPVLTSLSIASSRPISIFSYPMRSPIGQLRMEIGSISSTTAVMRPPRSGCLTAGRGCNRKTSRRRSIGGGIITVGKSSRCPDGIQSIPTRR
jgi:hypothetical protein